MSTVPTVPSAPLASVAKMLSRITVSTSRAAASATQHKKPEPSPNTLSKPRPITQELSATRIAAMVEDHSKKSTKREDTLKLVSRTYAKVYKYDHTWNQPPQTTITKEEWQSINDSLALPNLLEVYNEYLEAKKDPKVALTLTQETLQATALKLSNRELHLLLQFASNANNVEQGPIAVSPKIAKALKDALRNSLFNEVATKQDLVKTGVKTVSYGLGRILSFGGPFKLLEIPIEYTPKLLFAVNAFIRKFAQSGIKGVKEWISDKFTDKKEKAERTLRRTRASFSKLTSSSDSDA